jgi:hypothetical protein
VSKRIATDGVDIFIEYDMAPEQVNALRQAVVSLAA